MVLSIETAHELALIAARSEWPDRNQDGDLCLPNQFVTEFPWGWIFESTPADGSSNQHSRICVSVDRYSGKTQILSGSKIANDDSDFFELTLIAIGPDRDAVFQFVRELTGWNVSGTMQRFQELPIVLAIGPEISIASIHEALLRRGATLSITRKSG